MRIEKTAITKELMRIDTKRQIIDIQQIDNRRFMYNPKTGILVLGYQYAATSTMVSSHANELADAGITKGYDDFVRGWIGTGGDYPVVRQIKRGHIRQIKSGLIHGNYQKTVGLSSLISSDYKKKKLPMQIKTQAVS